MGSPGRWSGPRWTRSAVTPTPSATSYPTRLQFSTPSTWCGSAPRSSTRSAAACKQDTVGHRGHKDDPLYKIRGLLRHGVEHLTDKQQAKITACLNAGDPNGEVNLAWQCYQQLRSIYHAGAEQGRTICHEVLDSFPSCPIPEVARSRQARPHPQRVAPAGADAACAGLRSRSRTPSWLPPTGC